jgi:hypothetical protein
MDYDGPSEQASAGAGTMPMPGGSYAGKAAATLRPNQVNRLSLADEAPRDAVAMPLRERVYRAAQYAGQEASNNQRRYERALRCAQLMEAHPEVAELVELLREF